MLSSRPEVRRLSPSRSTTASENGDAASAPGTPTVTAVPSESAARTESTAPVFVKRSMSDVSGAMEAAARHHATGDGDASAAGGNDTHGRKRASTITSGFMALPIMSTLSRTFSMDRRGRSATGSRDAPAAAAPPTPPPLSAVVPDPHAVTLRAIFVEPATSPVLLPLFRACADRNYMPETVAFYEEYLAVRQAAEPGFVPSLVAGVNQDGSRRISSASTTALPMPGSGMQLPPAIAVLDRDRATDLVRRYVDPKAPMALNLAGALRSAVLETVVDTHATGPTARLLDQVGREVGKALLGNLLPAFRSYLVHLLEAGARGEQVLVSGRTAGGGGAQLGQRAVRRRGGDGMGLDGLGGAPRARGGDWWADLGLRDFQRQM
ncbi:hypothetical protein AMAG_17911 [Allomyces macrogynus ATCC 38327]|uniref:RGS domain-containing protein n=1 Tax=Allomyces macrogynus (strain ATCC 38327) TaxID=578462 RepID=A0A0L0S1S2_ALLM3|nr:hypothetical protein AMAG_17911 [Allomyces macrogynus ATCC 38327]|eukprot:KNE56365.1 hypothetical protein AMAG_17911 [Allomyces macrogynus ATCC 38327]